MSSSAVSPAISFLQALVQTPSINPEGISEEELSTGHYGEERIAHTLQSFLQDIGYTVSLHEVRPHRPNLIARAPGSDDRPRILLGPHLDTVGIEGMTISPFSGEITDGKLYGRGASDTKGPMAAMLWALKENAAILESAPVAIDFVGFMGEETQQLGSKHFAEHYGNDYEFAIVGEPTSLHIVNTTKGCLWTTLSTTGIATHASQPELGENAILKLQHYFSALQHALDAQFKKYPHPILGYSSWNLGVFTGGARPNIVAETASMQLDLRTTPALWEAGGAHELIKRLSTDMDLTVSSSSENPPMDVSNDHPWVKAIQTSQPSAQCVGAPWFSDAAHLNAGGIPAICLGPGSIDQAHTKDEFITVHDFEAGVSCFTQLVSDLCHGPT